MVILWTDGNFFSFNTNAQLQILQTCNKSFEVKLQINLLHSKNLRRLSNKFDKLGSGTLPPLTFCMALHRISLPLWNGTSIEPKNLTWYLLM